MDENDNNYSRCPNCGKYFINTEAENKTFCSNECLYFYKTCIVCGSYFIASRTDNKIYCSEICGINPESLGPPAKPPQDHSLSLSPDPGSREMAADNL